MPVITYITTKGSNIEKLTFSAISGLGILWFSYYNEFVEFQLNYLLYQSEKPYQVSFLLYTLMMVLITYTFEPMERFYKYLMEKKITKDFKFKFTEIEDLINFSTLMEEQRNLKSEYISVSNLTYIIRDIIA